MGKIKQKVILKSARLSKQGICTTEVEVYKIDKSGKIYVTSCITDDVTFITNQYEFEFSNFSAADDYFNSLLKGWIQ